MNSTKAPKLPAELAMPPRLEGLLSLLVASPMTLLGCTPDPTPADTEGSSSSGPAGSSTGSTGVADSGSTSAGTSTGDGTTSTGSTSTSASSSTTDASTSSGGPSESTSTSEGGESSTTGGVGNTCERVGDLMDMCFGGGYGYYYESSCNYYINYWIAAGDYACAQAYNEVYSCIADLECAEVFMGVYQACATEYDNMYATCYDWGGTFGSDSFGDSGVVFIVPETDGWATSGGSATGFFGSDTGFVGSDGGVLLDLPPP